MKYFLLRFLAGFIGLFFSCCQKKEVVKNSGVPRPDHTLVVILENHSYDQIIGSADAPYINELAMEGAVFTDAHGVTHPSQPNYLALFSGSTQGITDDRCLKDETPYTMPNLASALIKKGFSFTGFAESMPATGYLECSDQTSDLTGGVLYARKHAPWVNWQGTGENNIPVSANQPMTAFPADFSKLPTVAFVIPNQDYDMHNGLGSEVIKRADQWLKNQLGAYVDWAKTHNSLLILTFDEDDFTENNHILTLFNGAMIQPGRYTKKINHYNVLHTIEAMYDLSLSDTVQAELITEIWKK